MKGAHRPEAVRPELIELVTTLYFQGLAVVRILALIRAADSVIVKREESDETMMLTLTELAMRSYTTIRVACMLDEPARGNACLPQVFKLLADDTARAAVLDYPMSLARAERERHLENAEQSWARVSVDPRRDRLRKIRSHALAHNLMNKALRDLLDGSDLTTPDLADYAEECASVVGELAWACLGSSSIETARADAPSVADRIWKRMST